MNSLEHDRPPLAITLTEDRVEGFIEKIESIKKSKEIRSSFNYYFECRIDFIKDINKMEKEEFISILNALKHYRNILIFTLRTKREGGHFSKIDKYFEYLNLAEDILKPKFLDVEAKFFMEYKGNEESKELLRKMDNEKFLRKMDNAIYDSNIKPAQLHDLLKKSHKNSTKVIGSFHIIDEPKDKKFLFNKLLDLYNLNFDILKIASISKSVEDVKNMLDLPKDFLEYKKANPNIAFDKKDIIIISMGQLGEITRLYSNENAPFIFATEKGKSKIGQIFYKDMEKYLSAIDKFKKSKKKNIYIIGFMGVGKTNFGNILSKKLKLPFFDMDKLLEDVFKMSVEDYFSKFGEEAFRREEAALLAILSEVGPCVISCGGGIVTNKENIFIMKKSGIIVELYASLYTIKYNLRHSYKRPLLKDFFEKGEVLTLKKLFIERKDMYQGISDISISRNKRVKSDFDRVIDLYLSYLK